MASLNVLCIRKHFNTCFHQVSSQSEYFMSGLWNRHLVTSHDFFFFFFKQCWLRFFIRYVQQRTRTSGMQNLHHFLDEFTKSAFFICEQCNHPSPPSISTCSWNSPCAIGEINVGDLKTKTTRNRFFLINANGVFKPCLPNLQLDFLHEWLIRHEKWSLYFVQQGYILNRVT